MLKQFRIDPEKIVRFVLEKRNKNGGFGITAGTPPSIQDTYYALNLLKVFADIAVEKFNYNPSQDILLKRYLSNIVLNKNTSSKLFYFFMKSCEMSNINPPSFRLSSLLKSYNNSEYKLEDQFYIFKILKKPLSSLKNWSIIKELTMYLRLKSRIQESEKNKLIRWILRCQNPDGGFGFLPNSTSFIENTYFALKALNLLKVEKNTIQPNLSKALSFILYFPVIQEEVDLQEKAEELLF